ncbi:hypothetical protein SAMN05920897_11133 [Alkalispirochaeta americana]|uniref:Uncharacterized protein n=1 Tax=Alkalispirochaeta americana TaxID=159291 RepID=A0A1N6TXQ7_9SPIO|nr:hypothetical protein [Alkalispirochaeta americana]SIQ58112.1 hypothetical protein SAMN05920897_11133 [Alkalispirochaeta americana]
MDNDREVEKVHSQSQILARSKERFLQDIMREFRQGQDRYDLEAEFAKTKKNRSLIIPLSILLLVVVFSVVVIMVTRFIEESSLAIAMDIDDFADVNLRDLLDEAQRLQNRYDITIRERNRLTNERDGQVRSLERSLERELSLLGDSGLAPRERTLQAARLRQETEQQIMLVQEEFVRADRLLAEEMEELEAAIAQYDSRQLERAREQEEVLNNQQRLFEMEMQQLRDRYEGEIDQLLAGHRHELEALEAHQREVVAALRARNRENEAFLRNRFDPDLSRDPVAPLLDAPLDAPEAWAEPGEYRTVLAETDIADRRDYNDFVSRHEELRKLLGRLRQIPYENSLSPALAQLEVRLQHLVSGYEMVWRGLGDLVEERGDALQRKADTLKAREEALERFHYALDELSLIQGESGYILDPRDPEAIHVYVHPLVALPQEALGYVFRRDDELVGRVQFYEEDGQVWARSEDEGLRAFDRILIDLQGGE